MSDREQFQTLAGELRDIQDANKSKVAKTLERAMGIGIDPAGLSRFVAWKRQDGEKRAQREAIDHQCRFLAGEVDTPATLPVGCELARAIHLYRRKMTVRQVADELGVSTGKAGKLLGLSRMFSVHVHESMDKPKVDVITPPSVAALPAHDPVTGEVKIQRAPVDETTDDGKGIGHNSKRACILPASTTWQEITLSRDAADAAAAAEVARIAAEKEAVRERKRLELEAERAESARADSDALDFPAHLRRQPQVAA